MSASVLSTLRVPRKATLTILLAAYASVAQPQEATPAQANAPACAADAGWNDPVAPQRLFGNTWFVGTCGVSAILITTRRGHVLLDGTTAQSAPRVADNIRTLGFRVEDVRYILNSHAHNDHAGGIAQLQRLTGARVVSRGADAQALRRGLGDRSDPQFEYAMTFEPVAEVRQIGDRDAIALDKLTLWAHATPGHTPGSTSWTWRSCEGRRCLNIIYADSLTAISDDNFRYSDDSAHPGYLASFQRSIERISGLPCDILLTPHPGSNQLWQRLAAGGRDQLIDSGACRRYAEFARQALDARIAREAAQSR